MCVACVWRVWRVQYQYSQGLKLQTKVDAKVQAVMQTCMMLWIAQLSHLMPELSNKRLSCMQLSSLLCELATQRF